MHSSRYGILIAVIAAVSLPPAFAQPAPAVQAPRAIRYDTRNGYSLAFVEADVRRVVDAVLGSMLEVDYSVDPDVTGNVTLRTRQPVARESLLPLLESALGSVDAVLLVQGASYRVVSRKAARARAPLAPPTVSPGAQTSGFASEVVTLQNGSAPAVARLIEQFLGKEVIAAGDPASNQLIVTGSAEEREAARKLIARFDVDSLAGMNFEIYRLENVDPETLVREMERIFQPPFDILGSRVRLIPLPRLRSVLAVAAAQPDIARIEPWIRRLDAGASGKRKLYSYPVQNGRARDLARSLQMVLGSGLQEDEVVEPSPAAPAFAVPLAPAAPGSSPAGLGALEPSAVIGPQTPLPGSSEPVVATPGGKGPRIVPSDENNSLLIYADGEEYEFIREALEKLDQPVAQVLIEATLAEVTLGDDLRFGVNFTAMSGITRVTNSGSGSGTPAAIFPGFSVSVIGSSVQAVLNTLQSKTRVRVLSAPKLMVLNNQTATLQVGDQVPIVTQQAQSVAAPGAPIVNTIELRDTGVILKVTPRVNESGTITLDIAQEVSDVAETTSSGINSPTIQQRRIASTVATRSGQMIALGGLIRDRTARSRSGIPVLSQIPVLGGLFGSHFDGGGRTELIILLTPTVVRSPEEVTNVVDALVEGLERARPLVERARDRQVGGRIQQR